MTCISTEAMHYMSSRASKISFKQIYRSTLEIHLSNGTCTREVYLIGSIVQVIVHLGAFTKAI